MNSTKLLAHLLAIAQHSSEIRRELERGDAARAMVEAHAGLDIAHGKRPLPDAETCGSLALRLGVPEEFNR